MARKTKTRANFIKALRRLKKLKRNDQVKAMNMANNSFIKQFCREVKKLRSAKVSKANKKYLQKYKKQLRLLTNPKTGLSKRRNMLTQSGGGVLGAILRSLPVVGPIISLLDR